MTSKAFALLVAGASAATFIGVLLMPGWPEARASEAVDAPAVVAAAAVADAPAIPPDTSVYYSGCNAVRDAGKAPLYRDQPGYRAEMDGDDDGIACEPHVGGDDGGSGGGLRSWRRSRRR